MVEQLWTWSTAVAALLAAALTGGRAAVGELGARPVRWRVGWRWYAVVVLGPAGFSLALAIVYALLGGSWTGALVPCSRNCLQMESTGIRSPIDLATVTVTLKRG